MRKSYIERFNEIVKDADALVKGEIPPSREPDEERIRAFVENLYEICKRGTDLINRMSLSPDGLIDPEDDNRYDGDIIPPKDDCSQPGKRILLND